MRLRLHRYLSNQEICNHSNKQYVNGEASVKGMGSFRSMLKRGYHGTYHVISANHLNRYVQEFAGRHNIRNRNTLLQMVPVTRGMVGKRLNEPPVSHGEGGRFCPRKRRKTGTLT